MGACDRVLAQSLIPDCDNPQEPGVNGVAYIINLADIDRDNCTLDSQNPSIIETLALKTGKKAYKVEQLGNQPFTGTNTATEVGTYGNKKTKTVAFAILDHCPDITENVIDVLDRGSFAVIMENNSLGSDGKGKYEIYGYVSGLHLTASNRELYGDADGGWIIEMQSTERKSGMFIFNTDIATTDAMIAALL